MHPTHLLSCLMLLAFPARAQEQPHTMRVGVYGGVGSGWVERVADAYGMRSVSVMTEGAIVFNGVHGLRFGGQVTAGGGFLAGDVTIKTFDLLYSFQLNTSRRDGVSGSFGLLIGPSLAFVECAASATNNQTLLGARVGGFVDVNLGPLTLGLDASVRAGTQAAGYSSADWMLTLGIHAGFTFELPLSSSNAEAVARLDRRGRGADP